MNKYNNLLFKLEKVQRYFFLGVGLEPSTRYYYKCGDSSTPAMSREFIFETFPKPSPNNYPARIAVIGDLGLTSNSTSTIDHLKF